MLVRYFLDSPKRIPQFSITIRGISLRKRYYAEGGAFNNGCKTRDRR
jgi:hypothetical protein